uniref:Laminin G domain-containing protein n=1 Tax=Anopheles atroparvus TaxID=41427 RepID=A0A182IM21_ANOAO
MASVREEQRSLQVRVTDRERDRGGGPGEAGGGDKCESITESTALLSNGPKVIRLVPPARGRCKRKLREPASSAGLEGNASPPEDAGGRAGHGLADCAHPSRPYLCQSHSNCISNRPNRPSSNNIRARTAADVLKRNSTPCEAPPGSVGSKADNKSNHHCQRSSRETSSPPSSPSLFSLPKLVSATMATVRLPKMLLLGLLLSQLGYGCSGFTLDGSQTSFAQFRKWYTGLNGSLELEFKTEQPNGLVLYTDDGGTFDFFELKLVEGALRLRYNLGGGAQIITVGRDLHDGHWHKVQVLRNDEHTTLTVDGVSQSRSSRGKEFLFGKFATNSDVFVGGMPNW